uniref:NADH:ubiquinone oxidoreductase intermediate-associated protein 30 domain-containing protein n=1 Tax=Hemiselmis tepida TaxID=464990 RepID=A0A7S0W1H8_9CRYP|mmetsp:Transcript_36586/g.93441  ORF Transcript_36586/g.93441 Transcript_36586/m.93441 type:complete len:269 (+) Transcript_36586:71-877(+)
MTMGTSQAVAAALLLSFSLAEGFAPGFGAPPPTLRRAAAPLSLAMQADASWNFRRFAKTFTRFNGLPFLGPLGRAATVPQPAPEQRGNDAVLWGFGGISQAEFDELWAPLDDVVMGGVSVSDISRTPDGKALLKGVTSSRNNGGFCSARTRNVAVPYDLTGYQGVAIRAKSSIGMRYKLILRDREGWDTVAWCKSFDLPGGREVDVRVPFSDLLPVVRGRTVREGAIDRSSVFSAQIMVSKYEYDGALNPNFTEGEFALEFGSFRAYK